MTAVKTATSVTLSVTISAPYDVAFDFLTEPRNLPKWAINFVQKVEDVDGQLVATTAMGTLPVAIFGDRETGVVDQKLGDAVIPARLIRNGQGCDFLFSLQKPPDMPDQAFEKEGVPGLREEMDTLKRILENSH